MERNTEQQKRIDHPTDALAQSKAAMQEGAPSPTPNHNAMGNTVIGAYVRNEDRPRIGDDMRPPVPRPA
jgi:hypothetical protein